MLESIGERPGNVEKQTHHYPSEKADVNTEKKADVKHEGRTKVVVEDNCVFFEQYDKSGNLVKKTPPGYVPLDEKG